ncbi:hypothetical protein H0H81_003790 [Sphagnurus paluster]|uniref:ATP-dependent RNA helicase DHX29-like UBA domain-containing protein n=1 Tax=Sphagnurus paluster TaxID=117069 RepID=A0A9P7GQ53_9AGAR|nr:hypothetical protein H0H81_003790 [Sphagnurus paluster]
MARKKKTQLKPVARGFATTSVPKKVTVVDVSEIESVEGGVLEAEAKTDSADENIAGPPSFVQHDEFDPDKVEEQSLQNLVDKLQEKTEKEITRTIKVTPVDFICYYRLLATKAIEQDRRFSKTLPRLELDPALSDRVIGLVLESFGEGKKTLEEPEDKAIARLGVTYGVLRRLGFSESRVEECLRAIQGVDLEDAYEWLYLHCPEEELEEKRATSSFSNCALWTESYFIVGVAELSEPKTPRTPGHKSSRPPHTPRTPAEFLAPPTPTPKARYSTRLDPNAPTFMPSRAIQPVVIQTDDDFGPVEESPFLKAKILTSFDSSASDSGCDSPMSYDPAMEYAQAKLKLEILSVNGSYGDAASAAKAQGLRKRLTALKSSYFFDENDAEALYRVERDKANAAALQDRLRGNNLPSPVKRVSTSKEMKKRPPNLQPQAPVTSTTVPDIFDDDSGESVSGGIFEILDTMPTTETDSHGKTITIREMALPKHWSGRTPKTLLHETVVKADRYAAIGYAIISGASRAKRASVSIRWEGRTMDEWTMDDIACHDDGQAEQYIATVALHALTFPVTEGFATTTSATAGNQTFFRLLPAVFRDLWDELEASRKIREDATNRRLWAKLRSVIEPKLEGNSKVSVLHLSRLILLTVVQINDKSNKQIDNVDNSQLHRPPASMNETISDQLVAGFKARQASVEYQEMLPQRNSLPIAAYREEIIQILEQSQVLVLSGETGCGKSTQVPAFILEDQLSRGKPCVSRELGDPPNAVGTLNSLVGYSIRLESNTTRNTRLAFVTNGIALRMLEGGTGLGGQGTAFDEITVSLAIPFLRSPSLHRHHSISSLTKFDWSEETPAGNDDDDGPTQQNVKLEKRYSLETTATINLFDERLIPYDLILRLLERICFEDISYGSYSTAILVFMPGLAEIRRLNDILMEHPSFGATHLFKLYPLHSTLSSENQGAVFDIPPPGVRKIMAENPLPEMMRLSLSDLALRIKIMKVKLGSSIEDVLSRALDPPSSINVQRAVSMLVEVCLIYSFFVVCAESSK